MAYADERDAGARTPQSILTLGLPRCENLYAQTRKQFLQYTEDLGGAAWTLVGGASVVADISPCPREGEQVADRLILPANGDAIAQTTGEAGANRAFTASLFAACQFGFQQTIHVELSCGAEVFQPQILVTGTWTRFYFHKKFSGAAVGNVVFRIVGVTGDSGLNSLIMRYWGFNLTENLGALDLDILLPYVKRIAEADTTLAVMASRCQAADAGDGSRCYYTGSSCQDPANYNAGNSWGYPSSAMKINGNDLTPDKSAGDPANGIREYKLCLKSAPLPVKGLLARPQLVGFDEAPQEIDGVRGAKSDDSHGGFVTRNESVTYRLEDDYDPGNFDLEKASQGALTNTARGTGSFWRRLLAIHPNFDNPRAYAKLSTGYVRTGSIPPFTTEADFFKLRLAGPIVNIKVSPGGTASIEARDGLNLTKRKIPSKISSSNLLLGAITSGATSISVDDPTEISDPAPNAASTETFDSSGARTGGPDWVVVLQLGAEKLNVTAKTNGGNPLTVQRGRWGTTAIAHTDNEVFSEIREFGTEKAVPSDPVLGKNPMDCKLALYREAGLRWDQLKLTGSPNMLSERDTWIRTNVDVTFGNQGGPLFRRTLTDPTEIDQLLQEIDRDIVAFQWVDEDRLVNTKVFAPPTPSDTLIELTDVANFIADSVEVQQDNEARLSRVAVGWDLIAGKTGDVLGDYAKAALAIDATTEGQLNSGSIRDRIILSKWIPSSDTSQGSATARRILSRFVKGARLVTGSLECKDDDDVKLGSFVYVTTGQIQKPDGSTDSKRIMQVTKKERDSLGGRMKITFLDTGSLKRVLFISPIGHPDYNAATAVQRRYGFIGDTQNRVGTLKEDGYYVR